MFVCTRRTLSFRHGTSDSHVDGNRLVSFHSLQNGSQCIRHPAFCSGKWSEQNVSSKAQLQHWDATKSGIPRSPKSYPSCCNYLAPGLNANVLGLRTHPAAHQFDNYRPASCLGTTFRFFFFLPPSLPIKEM